MAREPGRASQDSSFAAGKLPPHALLQRQYSHRVVRVFLGAGDCINASPTRGTGRRDRWRLPEDPRPTSFRPCAIHSDGSHILARRNFAPALQQPEQHGWQLGRDALPRARRNLGLDAINTPTSFGKAKRKICERWPKEGVAERLEKLPQKMPPRPHDTDEIRSPKAQAHGATRCRSNPVEYHGAESRGDHARVFDGLCSCCGVATKSAASKLGKDLGLATSSRNSSMF